MVDDIKIDGRYTNIKGLDIEIDGVLRGRSRYEDSS